MLKADTHIFKLKRLANFSTLLSLASYSRQKKHRTKKHYDRASTFDRGIVKKPILMESQPLGGIVGTSTGSTPLTRTHRTHHNNDELVKFSAVAQTVFSMPLTLYLWCVLS